MAFVRHGRAFVLRTETGRRALELFLTRCLAMRRNKFNVFEIGTVVAANELKILRGGTEPISVVP